MGDIIFVISPYFNQDSIYQQSHDLTLTSESSNMCHIDINLVCVFTGYVYPVTTVVKLSI